LDRPRSAKGYSQAVNKPFIASARTFAKDHHGLERSAGKLLALPSPIFPEPALIPRERLILEHAMKHQHHFDTSEAERREAEKIRKMIGDLDRSVQLLNCDIANEEEWTRISDRSDAAYSLLARMLAARRDNLRETIAALEQRLSKLDQAGLVAEVA
jgi:hypothetical protein